MSEQCCVFEHQMEEVKIVCIGGSQMLHYSYSTGYKTTVSQAAGQHTADWHQSCQQPWAETEQKPEIDHHNDDQQSRQNTEHTAINKPYKPKCSIQIHCSDLNLYFYFGWFTIF